MKINKLRYHFRIDSSRPDSKLSLQTFVQNRAMMEKAVRDHQQELPGCTTEVTEVFERDAAAVQYPAIDIYSEVHISGNTIVDSPSHGLRLEPGEVKVHNCELHSVTWTDSKPEPIQ